ncbi:hypothetical protein DCS_05746 [Drechmeria coniospora]|uniref:Uncharacterized protein n=1 Tax=Drechmeria coniospora TaxID=98403 RepID=A0A151GNP5_DRECN|nr:hypothetical protein DCS_05746 [Drechmeria coniospora]KYK58729.1 hypothetical protein DCS_05746 [Drechmeria coniospora]
MAHDKRARELGKEVSVQRNPLPLRRRNEARHGPISVMIHTDIHHRSLVPAPGQLGTTIYATSPDVTRAGCTPYVLRTCTVEPARKVILQRTPESVVDHCFDIAALESTVQALHASTQALYSTLVASAHLLQSDGPVIPIIPTPYCAAGTNASIHPSIHPPIHPSPSSPVQLQFSPSNLNPRVGSSVLSTLPTNRDPNSSSALDAAAARLRRLVAHRPAPEHTLWRTRASLQYCLAHTLHHFPRKSLAGTPYTHNYTSYHPPTVATGSSTGIGLPHALTFSLPLFLSRPPSSRRRRLPSHAGPSC